MCSSEVHVGLAPSGEQAMRKALPTITEDLGTLKQRLQHEHDGRKKPRLQMLYLLASGQAHTRQEVAQLLGVHRNTIGH